MLGLNKKVLIASRSRVANISKEEFPLFNQSTKRRNLKQLPQSGNFDETFTRSSDLHFSDPNMWSLSWPLSSTRSVSIVAMPVLVLDLSQAPRATMYHRKVCCCTRYSKIKIF